MTPRPRSRWLAAIALSIVGLAGSRPADATVLSVDYVTIKVPVGNNLIHGACARISPGGLPQHRAADRDSVEQQGERHSAERVRG
ncbi:MAG: hypothetical protein U0527_02630 [Candidatus Eisenbacteria bacterium]